MSDGEGDRLARLAALLGHDFADLSLLARAMTHPGSVAGEVSESYERLEFLGDAVLGLIVSEMVFVAFPDASEGEMSRRRASLVRGETCANVAREVGLGSFVRVQESQGSGQVRDQESTLARVCEAVIGALYMDGGLAPARAFVERHWQSRMTAKDIRLKDAKSALQEWAHARGLPPPGYLERARSGPDHAPVFVISAEIDGLEPAIGEGSSKRAAEQAAAEALLVREGAWRGRRGGHD